MKIVHREKLLSLYLDTDAFQLFYFTIQGNGSSPNHSPDITNTAPGLESQSEKQQSNTSLPSAVQTKPQRNSVSVISTQVIFNFRISF